MPGRERVVQGVQVDLATIGVLDPAAIAQVHAEVTPEPTAPDALHDLLSSLVATRPRAEWRARYDELLARGRVPVAGFN